MTRCCILSILILRKIESMINKFVFFKLHCWRSHISFPVAPLIKHHVWYANVIRTRGRARGDRGSSEERSEPFYASRFRAGRRGSAFTCIINWTTGVCSYCIWSLPACPKEFWSSFAQVGALSRRCCCCCRRCWMIPPLASIKVTLGTGQWQ